MHHLEPEGDEQRVEHRRAHDEIQQPALQAVAEHEKHDGRNRQSEERIDVRGFVEVPRNIGAQHDERAVREVHDVEHPPNQRQAQCHHGIQPAQQDAVHEDLREEIHHRLPSADGIIARSTAAWDIWVA